MQFVLQQILLHIVSNIVPKAQHVKRYYLLPLILIALLNACAKDPAELQKDVEYTMPEESQIHEGT